MSPYYLIALVAFVGFLWLLVALPQKRINRRHQELVAGIEPGQQVMTAGGLHGLVRAVAEGTVALEIAPGVEITLARGAIAAVLESAPESAQGSSDSNPSTSS